MFVTLRVPPVCEVSLYDEQCHAKGVVGTTGFGAKLARHGEAQMPLIHEVSIWEFGHLSPPLPGGEESEAHRRWLGVYPGLQQMRRVAHPGLVKAHLKADY